jgi:hypothetical protein
MKNHELEVDSSLLLQELRLTDEPDPAALGRVRERVAVSLIAAPMASLGEPAQSVLRAPAPALHGAGWFVASKAAVAGILALGTAFGAVGYAVVRAPRENVVYRDRLVEVPANRAVAPAPSAMPTAAAPQPALDADPILPAPRHSAAPSAPKPSTAPDDARDLAAELRLIERARSALAAGDAGTALSALREHAAHYARGTLEQEREALWVKALVGAGRFGEARAASQRFAERYPNSTLLDSVNAAVRTIP